MLIWPSQSDTCVNKFVFCKTLRTFWVITSLPQCHSKLLRGVDEMCKGLDINMVEVYAK